MAASAFIVSSLFSYSRSLYVEESKNPDFVTALQRGLAVIEAFSCDKPELTLSEVAAITGLNVATVRRSLTTLEELGYVGRNQRRFVLRPKVLSLGITFLRSMNAAQVLGPPLRDLVGDLGGSASVAVLESINTVCLWHEAAADRAVRLPGAVGMHYPVYATAHGRALMSGLDSGRFAALTGKLEFKRWTDHTVRDATRLGKLVSETQHKGFALVRDELDYGLVALAIPVRDSENRAVAAIETADMSSRFTDDAFISGRLDRLRMAGRQIEDALRHFPALINSVLSGG
jgi:IclR family transcriptional regulator, pca regulon regulatory protein